MTVKEAFEAVAELHGINIEQVSSKAKAVMGDRCPPYKYQHTNDLFALCQDIWKYAYAAGMERAAEICDHPEAIDADDCKVMIRYEASKESA